MSVPPSKVFSDTQISVLWLSNPAFQGFFRHPDIRFVALQPVNGRKPHRTGIFGLGTGQKFAKRTGEQQAVDIDFGEFIELLGVLGPPVKAPPEPDRSKGFGVALAGHVATSAQKPSGKGSGGDEFQ